MTVNWQEPIEAVHTDGRVVEARLLKTHADGFKLVETPSDNWWCNLFGESSGHGWTIRNTPQATETPRTAPSQENGSGEVFERMKALCAGILSTAPRTTRQDALWDEARAIMALLAPEDGDLVEARRLVECTVHWSPQTDRDLQSGKNDKTPEVRIALAAIKRGRQLERGGE